MKLCKRHNREVLSNGKGCRICRYLRNEQKFLPELQVFHQLSDTELRSEIIAVTVTDLVRGYVVVVTDADFVLEPRNLSKPAILKLVAELLYAPEKVGESDIQRADQTLLLVFPDWSTWNHEN